MSDGIEMRMAAAALMEHGAYEETSDAIEWLRSEAKDMAALSDEDAIVAFLLDVAWWDDTQESDVRARRCARQFLHGGQTDG